MKKQRPVLLFPFLYYLYCLWRPPSVMLYILFDRIFQLGSMGIAKFIMNKFDDLDVKQIQKQDFKLMTQFNDKYNDKIKGDYLY